MQLIAGKYELLEVLGTGGSSTVYAARHAAIRKPVAVKLQHSAGKEREGLLAEARIVAKLKSEHATRVFDVGLTDDGRSFLVMERLRGMDAAQLLEQSGPFVIAEAVRLVLQAAEPLAEAHALGYVHRDLKPQNLFITRRGNGTPSVKVLDFGLAALASTSRAKVGGTPGYAAPEQIALRGDVDARADVWALGAVLYELIAGRRAFDADSLESQLVASLSGALPPLTGPRGAVPRALEDIVRRCLRPERDDRFPSLYELAAALAPFAPDALTYPERVRAALQRDPLPGPEVERARSSHASDTDSLDGTASGAWRPQPGRSAPDLMRAEIRVGRRSWLAPASALLGAVAILVLARETVLSAAGRAWASSQANAARVSSISVTAPQASAALALSAQKPTLLLPLPPRDDFALPAAPRRTPLR